MIHCLAVLFVWAAAAAAAAAARVESPARVQGVNLMQLGHVVSKNLVGEGVDVSKTEALLNAVTQIAAHSSHSGEGMAQGPEEADFVVSLIKSFGPGANANASSHLEGADERALRQAQDVLNKTVLNNIWNSSAADQAEIDADFEELVQCGVSRTSTMDGKLPRLNLVRGSHKACRKTESKNATEHKSKAADFKKLERSIPVPPSCPQYKQDLSSMTHYFNSKWNSMKKWYEDYSPIFESKQLAAQAANQALQTQKTQCDTLQTRLEQEFCSYGEDLVKACDTYTSCYQHRLNSHQALVLRVEHAVRDRKGLLKSIMSIICHLQVVLGTHSSNSHSEGHKECSNLESNHDTSGLAISYPKVPGQRSCVTDGFKRSPCDASWIREELTSWMPRNVKAGKCSRCLWEAPKPTPAPTPDPTADPTPAPTPAPTTPAPSPAPPKLGSDALMHYLDFDGNFLDQIGNTVASKVNDCSESSYVAGIRAGGSAFHFTKGCQVRLHNTDRKVTEWSVSFWFKPDSTIAPGSGRVDWLYGPKHGDMDCYTCWHLTMNRANVPNLRFYHSNPPVEMKSPTFKAGKWYNVFFTQAASARAFYLNGEVLGQTQTGAPSSAVPGAAGILVGSFKHHPAAMAIDELIFYNRSFAADDVRQIVHQQVAAPNPAPSRARPSRSCADLGASFEGVQTLPLGEKMLCRKGGWTLVAEITSSGNKWQYDDKDGNDGDSSSAWGSAHTFGTLGSTEPSDDYKSSLFNSLSKDEIMITFNGEEIIKTGACKAGQSMLETLTNLKFNSHHGLACNGHWKRCVDSDHTCPITWSKKVSGDVSMVTDRAMTSLYLKYGERDGAEDGNKDRVMISTNGRGSKSNMVDYCQGLGAFVSFSGRKHTANVGRRDDGAKSPGNGKNYGIWVRKVQ